MIIILTTILFNVVIRVYIEKDTISQLNKIASNAEHTALQHGPDFFHESKESPPINERNDRPLPPIEQDNKFPPINFQSNNDPLMYYFMLDRSLKEPFSLLNADFILLDKDKNRVSPFPEESTSTHTTLMKQITNKISDKKLTQETYLNLYISDNKYIAIIKPVSEKNSFGLGWIIIYSSVQKINQLQLVINLILFLILIFCALITAIFSSRVSKKISTPFSELNEYISAISERNFGNKIDMPVYDELNEFLHNINIMSEKLETYDQAQKTFLENVSHEFRTPLMSIQSYTEGIKYEVIDNNVAIPIILDETKRMTSLVEDLLYLSRLNSIQENFNFKNLIFNELIDNCVNRMNLIATKNNITIVTNCSKEIIRIYGDEEKLSRAITNIISNCIRYATNVVTLTLQLTDNSRVQLSISDDGPGFKDTELPNIFERFYKGTKGNFGLGLSITKNVVEKLNGKISASTLNPGASFIIELPIINIEDPLYINS
jgi:signal transduction histidine kinase